MTVGNICIYKQNSLTRKTPIPFANANISHGHTLFFAALISMKKEGEEAVRQQAQHHSHPSTLLGTAPDGLDASGGDRQADRETTGRQADRQTDR